MISRATRSFWQAYEGLNATQKRAARRAFVDELSQVKGVTPRVIDQLRPFVKTDGATQKIK